jgi:hypothetical protein
MDAYSRLFCKKSAWCRKENECTNRITIARNIDLELLSMHEVRNAKAITKVSPIRTQIETDYRLLCFEVGPEPDIVTGVDVPA